MKKSFANKIKRPLALCMAIIILTLCGCAGNQQNAESTPDASEPTETPALLAPTPAPAPVYGGTLRLAMPENADTSDPLSVNTKEMLGFFSLIYESLIVIDQSGVVTPKLAENWSCDDTGLVWTMKLRSSARWQDTGANITAADVVYSFERIKQTGGYYSYATDKVESIAAGSDGSVVVTMKQQGIASLYALNFPIIENPTASISRYGAGTGPYYITSISGDKVTLEINQNWWKEEPYIEKIEFYQRSSNDVSLASYVAGQLDVVFTSSLSVGRYREDGVTNVMDVMTQTAEVMLFNYGNSELSNPLVRQAIAYALNRSAIITNVYMNRARACDVPIAPDSWLYNSRSKVYDYNTELALSLFDQAGWKDTDGDGYLEKNAHRYDELTLKLLVNKSTDSTRETAAGVIASQLEAIGIHVEIVTAGFTLGDSSSEYAQMLENKDFDIALVGFNLARDCDILPYIDASGAYNYGGYKNDALSALARSLNTARDEAACREAADALQMSFVEDLPFITLYFRLSSILYHDSIKGLESEREPDLMSNIANWYIESWMQRQGMIEYAPMKDLGVDLC